MTRTRRTVIAQIMGGLAVAAAGPRRGQAQDGKIPKSAVEFKAAPQDGERCGDCANFLAGQNACKLVAGDVRADNWCKLWIERL